ncbi:hypothetical protein [Undibacterium umbellatum]|uniref:Uncharacterized protein n=1 Tax=Undibacterium umbellatum TaxID=2762300 RepID=A0ABR6Z8I3_9BURK|nr:hypothetical protein [Undibacterium umbellatum]MBC3908088.1 hypothetical protein [Undibacterium umbellatum]
MILVFPEGGCCRDWQFLICLIFLLRALQSAQSQQVAKFIAGGLFGLNAILQFIAYYRKKHQTEVWE